jgi:predicted  nucleic acid-binding Zn-ribbon protein
VTTPDLSALVALQALDTNIDQQRHRRLHLPERDELGALHREAAGLSATVAEVGAQCDDVARRQAEVEAELAATETRATSENRRLYSGEVRASRDLQALAADVETLKGRASDLEDQVIELLELREPLDARLADLAARIAAIEARARSAATALASSEADIDKELERLSVARAHTAGGLPADVLGSYDRLRARLDGIAIAHLVGNRCDGCHLTLPAMELDRIRHLPPSAVVTCDQCGRILVRG